MPILSTKNAFILEFRRFGNCEGTVSGGGGGVVKNPPIIT
jgi:hypothetical protein